MVFKLHKNRGKAKSYDEKQLEVGEFNETWLDGIDERIRKIRVTEDVSPFVYVCTCLSVSLSTHS